MKIGIDIHGVIDSHRAFFQEFTQLLIADNGRRFLKKDVPLHEIHILTGPSKSVVLNNKELEGIAYSHLFSITDYHAEKGTPISYVNGNPYMEEFAWNKTKADYAREHKLDLVFDDSLEYHPFFSTPFAWFQAKTDWEKKAKKGKL